MVKKIDKKIVGYKVATEESKAAAAAEAARIATPAESAEQMHKAEVVRMHESVKRPDMLVGSTYKVKTPVTDHAMYITVNDIILNGRRASCSVPSFRMMSLTVMYMAWSVTGVLTL